jgi:hypothetical protein
MDKNQENKQEELDQKISDAELDAQGVEPSLEEDTGSSIDTEPEESEAESAPPTKKTMSRARKIWRRALIWLVVVAIAFAGGFFLDAEMRYKPEMDRADGLEVDLNDARDEIASLEEEIDRLSQLEERNETLATELDELETHLNLLIARTAVADSSLAVEQDRIADARLSLDKLKTTLQTLKSKLNAEQADVVDNMLQRLQLIVIELEDSEYSVDTDLEVLTTRLITLENSLFATP